MEPWSRERQGKLEELEIESELLRGNPLGDPHERPLWVYTPPGYDEQPDRRYPSIYVIQGYTGHVTMWRNRSVERSGAPVPSPGCTKATQEAPAPVTGTITDAAGKPLPIDPARR